MKYQSNQFFQKYEDSSFEIFLTSSYDNNIVEGDIDFFDYIYKDGVQIKKNLAKINFFVFNTYNLEDMLLLADYVSSDLEYVASVYSMYSNEVGGIGSTAIIDEFNLIDDSKDCYEKYKLLHIFYLKQ